MYMETMYTDCGDRQMWAAKILIFLDFLYLMNSSTLCKCNVEMQPRGILYVQLKAN